MQAHLDDRLAPEIKAEIDAAVSISWLTFETYYDVIETLRTLVGNEGLRAVFEGYVLDLRNVTLYKPLLAGISYFGGGAEAMLRLYSRGYSLSFSNTGQMTLSARPDGDGVIVTLEDIPEICRREAYAHAHHGGVSGGFGLADTQAEVSMDMSELHRGKLVYDARALGSPDSA